MTPRARAASVVKRMRFSEKRIQSWDALYKFVNLKSLAPHGWIYRGQSNDWPLKTTIERALFDWNIELKRATAIEFQTIREFRRRTRDPLYDRVHTDTLSCLALMQHYGAPTRLLDCSYSPFAAAAFALEKGPNKNKPPVVWCFSMSWMQEKAKEKTRKKEILVQRNDDRMRTDDTFVPLYQLYQVGANAESERRDKFVKSENAFHLNERLSTQQGVFLCPADVKSRFEDNLKAMEGWNLKENIVKLRLELGPRKATEFVRNLKSMNLSFATLFPGLEGFARSINQQLFHFQEQANADAGLPGYSPRSSTSGRSRQSG